MNPPAQQQQREPETLLALLVCLFANDTAVRAAG